MSSILRALRRAERHVQGRRSVLAWPPAWQRDGAAFGRTWWVWAVAGILILASGIAGAVIGYRWLRADSLQGVASPAPAIQSPIHPPRPVASSAVEPAKSVLPKPVVGAPDPAFLKTVEKTVAQVATDQRHAERPKAPPSSQRPNAESSAETHFENQPPDGAPALNVQAVIWAPARDDRMVVVNNRFLHIGDPMDDVRILGIEEDGVIFQWRGQTWMQSHTGSTSGSVGGE